MKNIINRYSYYFIVVIFTIISYIILDPPVSYFLCFLYINCVLVYMVKHTSRIYIYVFISTILSFLTMLIDPSNLVATPLYDIIFFFNEILFYLLILVLTKQIYKAVSKKYRLNIFEVKLILLLIFLSLYNYFYK